MQPAAALRTGNKVVFQLILYLDAVIEKAGPQAVE
jgi:hypothetical protein